MKILIIHNKYQTNNIGGEDIVYQNELKLLVDKLGKDNIFFYEVSNDNINKFKLIFEIWFSFKHYKNIKKIIRDKHIDLVHIHNFFPLLTPSAFKAAKNAGAKTIHTLHNYRFWCISGIFYRDGYGICELCVKNKFSFQGILNKCYRKSFLQSIVAQASFWFYKMAGFFSYIDYFFVLTNFQKEKIKSLGVDSNKIILKPNGVFVSSSISLEKQNYIYVGRLEESKGICELLKIWRNLDKKFILNIVGIGDLEQKLKMEFLSENIIFYGKCDRKRTLALISSSKYLIQPSLLYETFGLTIIEAMGFGVPVIGYNIGTRSDFIKDNVNGFLADNGKLNEVIQKSFEYKKYNDLSKNAIDTAKMYENEYIINMQIEIYKQILEDKI